MRRQSLLGLFLFAVLFVAACGGGTSAPREADSAATGGSAPAPEADTAAGGQVRVDMDAIFPPGPGREILLNNCQNCHTWVPIVILQMDEAAWQRNSLDHRDRVANLSDEEFKVLYEYLIANFNPDRPVPELPPSLLETWTSY